MSWFSFLADWNWWKDWNKPKKRTMWVWSLDYNKQADILRFCQDKKINELYLCVPYNTDIDRLKIFVEASKQLEINIQLLYGDSI